MLSDPTAYTLVAPNAGYRLDMSTRELRTNLQSQNDEVKIETLRAIIVSTINGEPHASLLMPIIQYVLPSKNKQLKKMLHFYWEVCPKLDGEGKLKQEMILVCNAIRNDLQHPNEYIRGQHYASCKRLKSKRFLSLSSLLYASAWIIVTAMCARMPSWPFGRYMNVTSISLAMHPSSSSLFWPLNLMPHASAMLSRCLFTLTHHAPWNMCRVS